MKSENVFFIMTHFDKQIVPDTTGCEKPRILFICDVLEMTRWVKEIEISIECADTLNSFDDDILNKKIDDLVNEAINLKPPNCCECCQLCVWNIELVNMYYCVWHWYSTNETEQVAISNAKGKHLDQSAPK